MSQPILDPLFSPVQIATEVERLAAEIDRDYQGRELLLIGVLKGSLLFLADLMRHLRAPVRIDFVRLASYGSEAHSSGLVELRKDLEMPVGGRDVLIVEDIVDSGHTLEFLYTRLQLRKPRSLRICTLIDKRRRREVPIEADYVGFSLEDGFLVGYGLDYDELYRNLPGIYLLRDVEKT